MTRIIDFHARLGAGPAALSRLYAAMDRHGINAAAVAAGGILPPEVLSRQLIDGSHVTTEPDNDAVLAAAEVSAGRLIPVYFANPHTGTGDYTARAGRFRGLELSPAVHGVPLTDPITDDFVQVAWRNGHSVYIVCIIRPGCGVADLADLAKRHPETNFVLGHGGASAIDFYGVNLIEPHPNILFETSGGYSSVLGYALRTLGPGRILFGTEHPLQDPGLELAKFAALGLAEADWHQIAEANAVRLLKEGDHE
ncbi:putative TIM-barrel fold metal-dependent hydrolase [Allocatelliglobosispora scoriae]|uniref:Putative TIM-barrel fold metal-dependent hydrolase n=1 Tax=Allocatelliglobosispora scoriae TaxID=643052 RepID=A0A841C3B9_9ACTN|nr:amidohydrolase family protein [Allocatelliglobosispora scoriae]MBB5873633.1 putative TIM-barrel fold metal-dependent hydrolase [Allocatelliglobosispora scoriae]